MGDVIEFFTATYPDLVVCCNLRRDFMGSMCNTVIIRGCLGGTIHNDSVSEASRLMNYLSDKEFVLLPVLTFAILNAVDKARVLVMINCLHQASPTFSLESYMGMQEEELKMSNLNGLS